MLHTEVGLKAGTVIAGRFRVEDELGRGGMGAVFRAVQLGLERDVAVKVLLPQLAESEDARARFVREAKVASSLRHPNAVEVIDFGQDGDHLFMAMTFLRGRSLRDLLDAAPGAQDPDRTMKLAVQLSDVLGAAHLIPLVHRDIKPDNIFLERTAEGGERPVVVDFGLAFIAEHESLGRMTEAGKVYGSPAYMSPEQVKQGQAITGASDVYSLGCVLHEMLTGEPVFPGGGIQVLTKHVFSTPATFSERFPGLRVPPSLETILFDMLRKRPEERPSAHEVREGIKAILAGEVDARANNNPYLLSRQARMIQRPESAEPINETRPIAAQRFRCVFVGDLDEELRRGLIANGLTVDKLSGLPQVNSHDIVLGFDMSPPQLAVFTGHKVPVIADADPEDLDRVSELLKAGVAEVVMRPVATEDVVRKVKRAHKKARRRMR